jgi:hypothetical protein
LPEAEILPGGAAGEALEVVAEVSVILEAHGAGDMAKVSPWVQSN